jgi:protein-tyrosine phosphatase
MDNRRHILFVCTGNICRSPMAEVMFENLLPADVHRSVTVSSAGTHAADGIPAEPYAVRIMQEFRADLSAHRSRPAIPELVSGSDLVLVMEKLHAIQIRDFVNPRNTEVRLLGEFGGQAKNGDIPDPYGGNLACYRKTARQIRNCLDGVMEYLRRSLPL